MGEYERIKSLVKQHDMNLDQLAEGTGISINTIKKWGQGSEASVSNLLLIAHFFDVSLDYLTGNTKDPASHKSEIVREIAIWEEVQALAQQKIAAIQSKANDVPNLENG